ncbi:hypothetical protein BCR44DRAFT_1431100 [Catenaria anguillulae PL171]|uniref:Uncharacterized protein n=1 Tax=Catenaria anguillulae PL171 TaxID=765915 RepID=A0A1Y2HW82_9FUNG|nr:hypothetical protein BCR44DRAFT_1431100 [Catenaria anguillulae PL171]
MMGAPGSSRPVMSPARSVSRGRGSASASSTQQLKSGALPAVFAGVVAVVHKREPIVLIRPSTANYIALLPARIPWVGSFAYNIIGIQRSDTVIASNWFGLFFAYFYLILVVCLANKAILAKLKSMPVSVCLHGLHLAHVQLDPDSHCQGLAGPFAIICTHNNCFLDDDCTGLVWTTGHWTTAILSPWPCGHLCPCTYAFFAQAWWKIQHHLDIIEANWMTLTITWLKVTLVALNIVLPHNFWEVQIIQVLAMVGLLALVLSHHKSTNIKWWHIVQGVGIGSMGTTDPTPFLSALVPMWILVFICGVAAIRRKYRSIIIPRAREHRRLQSRFAKVMAFDASSSSYASSERSSGGDSSSIHSVGGLTKASVQT